ncbi:hypothetical protein G4H71_15575 [Rhodococcus triatomae]|uniref:Uncharacterized protein n=1 Tax=Rhodococcus triatomae TaxID=300028 RepID=A0A1G8J4C2_9NOCA|nr:hypothetical protein [Rhodococcus triatomae]QNG19818.1 hypothetical protein G4H72_14795 [Rhodococcus triatomae]QNG24266.1 hypothetical protein G4H71_15575 [Rhodococcus triatomae]SDI26074.1 hypothetical protein SAMN05444695_10663 [Rhodococcus triatomae]
MTDDTQQISVAELLKRNGQQVGESRGGRRRRGVAGGISVAELTGEIPVVRDENPRAADRDDEVEAPADQGTDAARSDGPSTRASRRRAEEAEQQTQTPATGSSDAASASAEPVSPARPATPQARPATPPAKPATPPAKPATPQAKPATPPAKPATQVSAPALDSAPTQVRPPLPSRRAPLSPAPVDPASGAADEDDDEPVASRPSFRAPGPKSPSRDNQGAWISHSAARGRAAVPRTDEKGSDPVEIETVTAESSPRSGADEPADEKPTFRPEPALLSGSTLAGDLLRQSRRAHTERDEEEARAAEAKAEATAEAGTAEDAADDDAPEDEARSSTREWLVLAGQGVAAVIAGALMFKGFEKLWDTLPWVALILAVLVIVGLVAMVRILRRTDDITSFVIAVVVGMIVTLGPLAFMLASG